MVRIRALFHDSAGPGKGQISQLGFKAFVVFAFVLVLLYSFYIHEDVHNPSMLSHHAGHLNSISCSSPPSEAPTRLRSHGPPIVVKPGDPASNLHQCETANFKPTAEPNGCVNDTVLNSNGIIQSDSDHSRELGGPLRQEHRHECEGKFVYIYKLPPEFNEDLVDKCGRVTNKWVPLCGNLNNKGYGPLVPTKTRNTHSLVDLEPPHAWYRTEQFSLELIFHERLRGYTCLTEDPELANAFYIPYYAALDTAFTLFDPNLSARDRIAQRLIGWLSGNTVWTKFQGDKEHFMVLGRIAWDFSRDAKAAEGWGSALLSQRELSNVTKLLIEKRSWVSKEMAIPYPTSFHPSSLQDVQLWQEKLRGRITRRRKVLCSFTGSTSRGTEWSRSLRAELAKQCHQAGAGTCEEYNCGDGNSGTIDCVRTPEHVTTRFLSSTFCLQPSGDSSTRKSIFDSLLAGCIPVLFTNSSAYTQYMWHLPQNGSLYSLFFDGDDVIHGHVDIFSALTLIADDTQSLRRMQEEIIRILPRIVYSFPGNHSNDLTFHDAFDVALQHILEGSSIRTS